MNIEHILSNLVRKGKVSAVDAGARRVRVIDFERDSMTSDWLFVLGYPGVSVSVSSAGSHSHTITDSVGGAGSASTNGAHGHLASVSNWMPAINDTVLVLYLPVKHSAGFVLGVI